MRSSKFIRSVSVAAVAFALFTGALSIASAQDATAEPTEDAMMSQMRMMQGACPEGAAAQWFDQMSGMMGMGDMEATEDADDADTGEMEATMEATHDMSSMDMATQEPGAMATDEMGMAMEAKCLVAEIHGSEEVPGPGDDDAWGVAFLSVDPASGTICYDIAVANITLPAAANHIHAGEAGVGGGVVVPFPTAPDADGKAWGCASADASLAQSIVDNPASYYYNVHTSDFPDGAARGQLTTWDDAMIMWSDSGMNMNPIDKGGMEMSTVEPGVMATPEATASS